jgi:hypothetical protein
MLDHWLVQGIIQNTVWAILVVATGFLVARVSTKSHKYATNIIYGLAAAALMIILLGQGKALYYSGSQPQQVTKNVATDKSTADNQTVGAPARSAGNHASIRKQLGSYLGEGEQLKRRCLNKEDAKVIFKDANQWVRLVATYLDAKLDSSYAEQFFSPPAQLPIGHDIPPDNDNLWRTLNGHTEVLRKFLAEFKD